MYIHVYREFNTALTNKKCTYRTFFVLYDMLHPKKILKKTWEELSPIFPIKQ